MWAGDGGEWAGLAAQQEGVVARRQLLALGLTAAQARQRVDTGHWRAVFPGVYATFTGPMPELAQLWAALLYVGPPVCASHGTALWLAGGQDRPASAVHLTIPADRRVRPQPGIRIHLSRNFPTQLHPSAQPPRSRIEDAVLDLADTEPELDRVLDSIFRVTQRRLTTADRLRARLAARGRHHWRRLLEQVLAEVDDGVASALELRYANDVERRHGLPQGERNLAEPAPGDGNWYRDVRYRTWRTVVELDGRAAHPSDQRFRDMRRDNHAAEHGETALRYRWHDVAGRPCIVAHQVITVLQANGCPTPLRPCPQCPPTPTM